MAAMNSGDVFTGHYRLAVKTAIFRDVDGQVAPAEQVADIPTLLGSLPSDADMRAKYPDLKIDPSASPEAKLAVTPFRVAEEQRNVTIPAWIWYVRKETDNDFHVIIGSSADPAAVTYMNVEVSGLPVATDDPNFTDLQNAREQLTGLAGHDPSQLRYEAFTPPLPVTVTGSLLYDGDHVPGEVGPVGHKPQTTWEIHPVTTIQQRQ
jgi:hypothetical protein